MTNYAIILAGGFGGRFGGDKLKQFVKIGGEPILWHTVKAFNDCEKIDKIIVVANRNFVKETESIVDEFSKLEKVIAGGKKTRSQSAYNGIVAIDGDDGDNILIHDGVRPFVSNEIIENCINSLEKYDCVSTVIPATDTLYEMENNEVKNIPNRDSFAMAQTPQGFKYETIKQAYDLFDDKLIFSDDCALIKYYLKDVKIGTVAGDKANKKITTKEDL